MEGGILRTNIGEGKYEPKLEFPTRKGRLLGRRGEGFKPINIDGTYIFWSKDGDHFDIYCSSQANHQMLQIKQSKREVGMQPC